MNSKLTSEDYYKWTLDTKHLGKGYKYEDEMHTLAEMLSRVPGKLLYYKAYTHPDPKSETYEWCLVGLCELLSSPKVCWITKGSDNGPSKWEVGLFHSHARNLDIPTGEFDTLDCAVINAESRAVKVLTYEIGNYQIHLNRLVKHTLESVSYEDVFALQFPDS